MRGASLCYVFFSSRRRHTRFDCDWSSDVCSSDLAQGNQQAAVRCELLHQRRWDLRAARGNQNSIVGRVRAPRSEEHTSELQSQSNLVCRLLLEKKKKKHYYFRPDFKDNA